LSALGFDFDTVGRRRADDDAERSDAEERRRWKADDAADEPAEDVDESQ
jgi:signal peptidase II